MASDREQLELPDEFTCLTMWLRLVSILNNGDGDISMRNYAQINLATKDSAPPPDLKISDYEVLDSMTAVLIRNQEIVSACYNGIRTTHMPLNFTVMANPTLGTQSFGVRIARNGSSIWSMIQEGGAFKYEWRQVKLPAHLIINLTW